MIRKIFLFLVVSVLLMVVGTAVAIRMLGGAFEHEPEEMKAGLSSEAKTVLAKAYEGLDENSLWDYHTHIVGAGEEPAYTWVNPDLTDPLNLVGQIRLKVYLDAGGVDSFKKADSQYVDRLLRLIRGTGKKGKYSILGFDRNYSKDGTANPKATEFFVSNEYIFHLAEKYSNYFEPVISVHPYRKDALEELRKGAARGAKMVKWLPNAMGIDPSDPLCIPFYDTLKELNLTLLTHAGEEQAVASEEGQKLGNPLRVRSALDRGVKVIMAHGASRGLGEDLDKVDKPKVENFELFARLMDEERYHDLLFADISAITLYHRIHRPLRTLLEREDWHSRLVNGSDYPLPAINFLIQTGTMEEIGYINSAEREALNEIYHYNPLLFDFVLKRILRNPETNKGFADSVFMKNPKLDGN